MTSAQRWPVAIIGSGNIGTDLLIKILSGDGPLTVSAVAGGVDGLLGMRSSAEIKRAFDATSVTESRASWAALRDSGIQVLDLTPAAIGPFCVPAVNLDDHRDAPNVNMVTPGAQAAVPIVAAVAKAGIVSYAETVSSISAKSAGPGTRANIDEFIETTATALQVVGGAQRGKAVIILNPADPPVPMRNTVYCLVDGESDHHRIEQEIHTMADRVAAYVPGYRLKQDVQFQAYGHDNPLYIPETGKFTGTRVTVMLEVPADIMAAAAMATAEHIAAHAAETAGAAT